MKAIKRTLALLMCMCLLACTFVMTTSAAENGTITIKNPVDSAVGVGGKTFEIYKIFDATYDAGNISYAWTDPNPYGDFFKNELGTTDVPDILDVVSYVRGLSNDELVDFSTALYNYIAEADPAISPNDTKTADVSDTSVSFTGKDYGYYLVYDSSVVASGSVRSAVMLSNAAPTANITLKVDLPTIVKQVKNNDGAWAKGTSTNIGHPLDFQITAEVPDHSDYTNGYTYIIKDDHPDGMTINFSSIKVFSEEKGQLEETVDYKLTVGGLTGADYQVEILDLKDFTAGDKIIISYTTELTANTQSVSKNTATLVYSNDPTRPNSTGEVTDFANIYSYSFIFSKFAQDGNGHLRNLSLAGAEFELYKVNADNSTTQIYFDEVPITYDHDGEEHSFIKYVVNQDGATQTIKTDDDGPANTPNQNTVGGHLGEVVIFGLAEGKYLLKEITAPNGYILPKEPFEIEIKDTIGSLTGVVAEFSATGAHTGEIGKIFNVRYEAGNTLTVWADITNMPGEALPETGGMGTTLFTVIGIVLMAGAIAFFTLRKRNSMA